VKPLRQCPAFICNSGSAVESASPAAGNPSITRSGTPSSAYRSSSRDVVQQNRAIAAARTDAHQHLDVEGGQVVQAERMSVSAKMNGECV